MTSESIAMAIPIMEILTLFDQDTTTQQLAGEAQGISLLQQVPFHLEAQLPLFCLNIVHTQDG